MYQQCMLQLMTPLSLETLFIQLRDPTHSQLTPSLALLASLFCWLLL